MDKVALASHFISKLPGPGGDIAYHLAVLFDGERPTGVVFTSFVGAGRRSFEVRAPELDALADMAGETCETLCRIAIGQTIRDNLHDKASIGDYVLDLGAPAWHGELRPVGMRVRTSVNLPSRR